MATVTCPGCQQRDARIQALEQRAATLEQRIAELEALVRELRAQLGRNATNSSLPPSANPPDAPKPVTKPRTGKKPGGQPGHQAHLRRRLPPERVARTLPFVPKHCQRCQEPLPPQPGPDDPEPSWHQVAELPVMAAQVTEYQGHFRTCPCCGTVNHAPIPADIKAYGIGPRLAATLAYLAGSHHVSKRGLEEIAHDAFDVPLALGTVAHLEAQMSAALAGAHAEALAAVRAAPVKHVDETGWRQAGQRRWLWLAGTATVAVFLIHARRSFQALKALLGSDVIGFLCSDRWPVYDHWPLLRRQICWAHLKRDFQKLVDRGGPAARIGQELLAITGRVFEQWHLFRGGGFDRSTLSYRLDADARAFERLLNEGRGCADAKAAAFCANILALLPAVWRFVVSDGIEPTNNHAERLLRRGVLWRKNAFGCHSDGGCRFVERLLTVVQTRRLQGRSVLRYLHEALLAHRNGLPAPSLLTAE
jgi:transposase